MPNASLSKPNQPKKSNLDISSNFYLIISDKERDESKN